MPLIAMIFWLLVVLLMVGALVIPGGLMWLAHGKKWRVAKWVMGLLLLGGFIADAAVVVVLGMGWARTNTPALVFTDTFHEKPPAGTTVLNGSSNWYFDSAGVDLSFMTDRATFDRLRPSDLDRITMEKYRSHPTQLGRGWWREPTPTTEIWAADGPGINLPRPMAHTFNSEAAYMTWDEDGLVQYSWSGID